MKNFMFSFFLDEGKSGLSFAICNVMADIVMIIIMLPDLRIFGNYSARMSISRRARRIPIKLPRCQENSFDDDGEVMTCHLTSVQLNT